MSAQDKLSDDDIAFYEHTIVHYESLIDSDHKTREEYNTVEKDGDSYRLGQKIDVEEFARVSQNAEKIEISTQNKKLTGTTRATQNTHVEEMHRVTVRVYPEVEE